MQLLLVDVDTWLDAELELQVAPERAREAALDPRPIPGTSANGMLAPEASRTFVGVVATEYMPPPPTAFATRSAQPSTIAAKSLSSDHT